MPLHHSNSSPSALTQSDVREVLQYVPIFSGKTFVVTLDGKGLPDMVMAEILLDLISLQRIGVQLVIAYSGDAKEALLDWAADVELKLSEATAESVQAVLSRGQAALVNHEGELAFNEELVQLALNVGAHKILHLGQLADYPVEWEGALKLASAQSALSSIAEMSHWVLEAVSKGVQRVHLLDGTMPGCLSRELFSNEGVGVMIYRDSYQGIRALSEEDIPELLAIIGRSIRAQDLLPRNYEEIETNLADYFVMAIDGNVVGSVALHAYEGGIAELACLFVKESHKGLGYGNELVKFAEREAQNRGVRRLFALSTGAGGFFERQLGYKPMPLEEVPASRRTKLELSGRDSLALIKDLTTH